MIRDEHEEECNSHIDDHGRREDDHQEDNFQEVNHRELRNRRPDLNGDLSRVLAELKRRCTYMEIERKDKSKSAVVDKLLTCIYSPFTRRVADYRLPEKFKVPQILSYAEYGIL
jgi:hypothetical protein